MNETKPKRILRRRAKGWRMPPNTVYVGRPTRWGNPCPVDQASDNVDRQVAVEMYQDKLAAGELPFTVEDVRRELAGKNLACWCHWSWPCHADVLLRIANVLQQVNKFQARRWYVVIENHTIPGPADPKFRCEKTFCYILRIGMELRFKGPNWDNLVSFNCRDGRSVFLDRETAFRVVGREGIAR